MSELTWFKAGLLIQSRIGGHRKSGAIERVFISKPLFGKWTFESRGAASASENRAMCPNVQSLV